MHSPRLISNNPTPTKTPRVPEHVAIIMDGNGRWAQARGQIRTDGHTKGAEAVREAVRTAGAKEFGTSPFMRSALRTGIGLHSKSAP